MMRCFCSILMCFDPSMSHFKISIYNKKKPNNWTIFFHYGIHPKTPFNFNSMNIYFYDFLVLGLEYKIPLFILNLSIVGNLQQTFYNPNTNETLFERFFGVIQLVLLTIELNTNIKQNWWQMKLFNMNENWWHYAWN